MSESVIATCSGCKTSIEAGEEYFGEDAKCPQCGKTLYIPYPEPKDISPIISKKSINKACPYCGETILSVAKKCKHCGEFLDDKIKNSIGSKSFYKKSIDLGLALLICPTLFLFFCWYYIPTLRMYQNPGAQLTLIALLNLFITAILIAVEYNSFTLTGKKNEYSAAKWFFLTILCWIIVYPAYMYCRSKYGGKNLLFGAIIIAILFAGTVCMMSIAIQKNDNDIDQKIREAQNLLSK
ncbi:MAG: hypothetical protein WCI51_07155 [Lentisphaerota bacterium]